MPKKSAANPETEALKTARSGAPILSGALLGALLLAMPGGIEGLHLFWGPTTGSGTGGAIMFLLGVMALLPLFFITGLGVGSALGALVGALLEWLLKAGEEATRGRGGSFADPQVWRRLRIGSFVALGLSAFLLPFALRGELKLGRSREAGQSTAELVEQREENRLDSARPELEREKARKARLGKQECRGSWCSMALGEYDDKDVVSIWGAADDAVYFALAPGRSCTGMAPRSRPSPSSMESERSAAAQTRYSPSLSTRSAAKTVPPGRSLTSRRCSSCAGSGRSILSTSP